MNVPLFDLKFKYSVTFQYRRVLISVRFLKYICNCVLILISKVNDFNFNFQFKRKQNNDLSPLVTPGSDAFLHFIPFALGLSKLSLLMRWVHQCGSPPFLPYSVLLSRASINMTLIAFLLSQLVFVFPFSFFSSSNDSI